jgi:hypothetical protein
LSRSSAGRRMDYGLPTPRGEEPAGEERRRLKEVTPPRRGVLDSGEVGWEEEGAPGESFEYSVPDAHPEVRRFSHASLTETLSMRSRASWRPGVQSVSSPLGVLTGHDDAEIWKWLAAKRGPEARVVHVSQKVSSRVPDGKTHTCLLHDVQYLPGLRS